MKAEIILDLLLGEHIRWVTPVFETASCSV